MLRYLLRWEVDTTFRPTWRVLLCLANDTFFFLVPACVFPHLTCRISYVRRGAKLSTKVVCTDLIFDFQVAKMRLGGVFKTRKISRIRCRAYNASSLKQV